MKFLSQSLFLTHILATRFRRTLIFQNMNSVRSKNLSLKNQRCATSDGKDIGINLSLWQTFISVLDFFILFQEKVFLMAKIGLFVL